MPRLVVEKGVDKGKEVLVTPSASVVVGREVAPAGNIRVTDTMVSRAQFKIVHREGAYYLIDGDSRNGTFVNGNRVREERLEIGAKIDVGETMLSFLADTEETKRGGRVGQMVGGYRILERVGRGGMGTVYKALQLSLNRVVALKLLADELVRDQSFINLFIQEARAAAQLNHPNIVQVYDVNRVAERDAYIYYFSMEYLPNGSVQDHLGKEKKLTPKKATRIVLDAARGLEYAEKKKIVHRDIKPDNLMIGEDSIVKICDLGLAKKIDPAMNVKDEKEQGCVFGTPHYVAPEQALGRPADHRSDIYSLGSTLYRLLAGQTPYQGTSAREIVIAKVKTEPPPLAELDPTIPANLVQVVEMMMKKDPDQRYQTAAEVVQALEALKVELEGGPTTLNVPTPTTGLLEAPSFAQRVLVPFVMFLVMCGLGAAGYLGYRHFMRPNVDGPHGGPPNPIVSPLPTDSKALEKLAKKYFDDATDFEHTQMDKKDTKSLEDAIARYQLVLTEAKGTRFDAMAQAQIENLRKSLKLVSAGKAIGSVRETKQEIERLLSSTEARKVVEERLRALREDLAKALEAITRSYDGSDEEKEARQVSEEVEKAFKDFFENGKAYDEATSDVKGLKELRKYGAAVKRLQDFAFSLTRGSWYDRHAAEDLKLLKAEAVTAWSSLVAAPAQQKRGEGDFDGARKMLAEQADLFDLQPFRDDAERMRKEIDEDERRHADEAAKRQRETDLALYEGAYVKGLPFLLRDSNYRFDRAMALMMDVRAVLKTPEVLKMAEERAEVLGRAGALKATLLDRVNGRKGTLKKKTIFYQHEQATAELLGEADDDQVRVSYLDPKTKDKVETKLEWGVFPGPILCPFMDSAWDLSAEEHLGLGLLTIEEATLERQSEAVIQKLIDQARGDLQAAKRDVDGAKQPRVLELASLWLDRLANFRATAREETAAMCLRVGDRALKEARSADAVQAYEWISKRLDDTQEYLKAKDGIAKILDAEKNHPK